MVRVLSPSIMIFFRVSGDASRFKVMTPQAPVFYPSDEMLHILTSTQAWGKCLWTDEDIGMCSYKS